MVKKKMRVTLFAFVLVASLCFGAQAQTQTVLELLSSDTDFSILVSYAQWFPAILNQLSDQPSTLFAPNNAAFEGFVPPADNATLENVLLYHVHGGFINSSQLFNGQLISTLYAPPTLAGPQVLKVNLFDGVFVNNAPIIAADLQASNGYIHTISAIIAVPSDIVNVAVANGLTQLVTAVTAAGLDAALRGANLTVFAPTNAAFLALPDLTYDYLFTSQGVADLTSVLLLHVAPQVIYATGVPTTATELPTLGGVVVVENNNGVVTINSATVQAADLLASNGVVHTIDQVLVPASFEMNSEKVLYALGATTFVTALGVVNLTSILTGPSFYTIFAPSNPAFDNYNDLFSDPTDLLNYMNLHIINGSIASNSSGEYQTLSGKTLVINGEQVYVKSQKNGARAGILSINESPNGLIFIIDTVLVPGDEWNMTAVIVVLVIIGVVVLAAAAGLIYYCCCRKAKDYTEIKN